MPSTRSSPSSPTATTTRSSARACSRSRRPPTARPGVGTVYASTVKDAGVKTKREFEYTEFEQPTKIRWSERSKNMITVPEGGYDIEPAGDGTKLTFFNEFEGHGLGKVFASLALRAAQKQPDDFANAIKNAVEADAPSS